MLRLGIDLGGTKIEGIALDDGREVGRRRVSTPRGDYDATVAAVVGLVTHLEADAGQSGTVGVGIPGSIAPGSDVVRNANSIWLIGRPFAHDLEHALGRPVRVANDANCFAVSEAADGAAAGALVVFGVIIGTGVGAGIVVRGRPLEGVNAIAGEWGHNPLPWMDGDESKGRNCYCGLRGCIETFLSGPAMEFDYEQEISHLKAEDTTGTRKGEAATDPSSAASGVSTKLTAAAIAARGAAGDVLADRVLRRYESRMARACASVINLLDPDVIVLGGGMSNIDRLYQHVPQLWGDFVFGARDQAGVRSAAPVRTRLVQAKHGDSSGVRGAAGLWR